MFSISLDRQFSTSSTPDYRALKKVNVDFPQWVIESLDKEAKKIGVTRQSIIKVWIAERLKEENTHLQAS